MVHQKAHEKRAGEAGGKARGEGTTQPGFKLWKLRHKPLSPISLGKGRIVLGCSKYRSMFTLTMEQRLLSLLPVELRQTVEQIETRIGNPIRTYPLTEDCRRIIGNFPMLNLEQRDGRLFVDVMLPRGDLPPAHAIGHEILHAKRAVLDSDPILLTSIASRCVAGAAINNDVAHLRVIPEEMGHFREAGPFWKQGFSDMLVGFASRILNDPDRQAVRNDMLRAWLVASVVLPDWDRSDHLKKQLEEIGAGRDADNLTRVYSNVFKNKIAVLSALVRFHRFEATGFQTVTVGSDPVPLPSHS
ncbi:hypothetical protein [Novosphingobium colocasiae]|uniref:hypothetical protein n=1 Tax=Novosphingobium colocasiae TaxID=1256513 RepID=UPI0035AE22DA